MTSAPSAPSALVIGSGIAGAATAFALARRGSAVTVVDAGHTGQATAASAGIIQPWSASGEGPFFELYQAGAAFYPALLRTLSEAGVSRTDFRRSGALLVNEDENVLDDAAARVIRRAEAAPQLVGSVERIDNAAARRLFPPLSSGLKAVYIAGGARVDGRTLRDALLHAAVSRGAQVVGGSVALSDDRGRVSAAVDGKAANADVVVVAAGAWSAALLAPLGVRVPVSPQRGQITHLRLAAETGDWPTVHPLSHHYIVAFDGGRIAVGATRETGTGFDPRVTAAGQAHVLNDALAIAPGLADATLIETRVGLRPLPDGSLPSVGAVRGMDGLFLATGYGAAGLTMGPLLGDALARAIHGEDAPELEHTGLGG
ncbi:NAD(P)/FAD-dependent oxidoreductase [Gryllotalpicola ginsengisoli]|uniref:NAD(P)/FAD-dependent oxidoreductase n=1 Tax=Gryllotalpicola ginsengisoli TaxID=444608 RepID=UPI0003B345BE|nr:FAD-dependent oxidoreductase [Gryllotalpicola ginsengisoli]